MSTKPQVRAAIYVRISKDSELLGLGVARQLQDCRALAEARGWQVVEVFEDNDVSATSGKPRPAYRRMTQAIERGDIQGVVVWDVDRLTRTPRELEDVIDWADKYNLHLANVGGDIDLATPQGRMTARIKGTVARHEIEQQSRRLKRKAQEMAEAGKHVGRTPYGWRRENGSLVLHEEQARLVREAYRRVLDGETIYSLVNHFNNASRFNASGNPWTPVSLRKILLRWTNCGVRTHHGKEMGEGDWEPLVSREEHERMVALLTAPERSTKKGGKPPESLLSGLLECKLCGSVMWRKKGRKTYTKGKLADGTKTVYEGWRPATYQCGSRECGRSAQDADALDEFVTELALAILERQDLDLGGEDAEEQAELLERAEALEAKLAVIADQFMEDAITESQLKRMTGRLRPELEEVRKRLEVIKGQQVMPQEFRGATATEAWNASDIQRRREVLRILRSAGLSIRVGMPGRGVGLFNLNEIEVTMP